MRRLLLLAVFGFAAPLTSQTINTNPTSVGTNQVGSFGKTNTATYGQTFIAPGVGLTLNSFSFELTYLSGGSDLLFRGYLSAWDEATHRLIGPTLYTSATQNGPVNGGGLTSYLFNTGGISLGTGTYVAFISASGLFGSIPSGSSLATTTWNTNNAYADGQFVFLNNGDDAGAWTNQAWSFNHVTTSSDARVILQFGEGNPQEGVVPEPATMTLLASGLIGLAGAKRRRKKS